VAPQGPLVSIVIPVFNSEHTVADVISRSLSALADDVTRTEVIAVDDGSQDGSWSILTRLAHADARVTAVALERNSGQHTALLCGLRLATGDFVVCLDDDLQHPPEAIPLLLARARQGHDVVCGVWPSPRHPAGRRLGSRVVRWLDRRLFGAPPGLAMTSFRVLRRDLVDRLARARLPDPYLRGLIIAMATHPASVEVQHGQRARGTTGYTPWRLTAFLGRVLFTYSAWPLRVVCVAGGVLSAIVAVGAATFAVAGSEPALAVATGAFAIVAGMVLLAIAVLGEYIARLLRQRVDPDGYRIREIVRR